MACELELIHEYKAVVDEEDYAFLSQWTWYPYVRSNGVYVGRRVRDNGRQKTIYLHRLLLNAPKGIEVDHINGNPLDNRKSNIRLCTRSQNNQNIKKTKGKIPYKGVSEKRDGYQVSVAKNGKRHWVGSFKTIKEAALAYNKKATELFGEFASVNEVAG
jgi:hypothetical protein